MFYIYIAECFANLYFLFLSTLANHPPNLASHYHHRGLGDCLLPGPGQKLKFNCIFLYLSSYIFITNRNLFYLECSAFLVSSLSNCPTVLEKLKR